MPQHFDYKDLSTRLMNNEKVIQEVLVMTREYLENLPIRWDEIESMNNLSKLNQLGHSIKGIGSTASFFKLAEMGKSLQELDSWDESRIHTQKEEILNEAKELIQSIDLVV